MIIMTTNFGDIEIELNLERAPVSSKNFKKYCEEGFYNGTIFHRVIDGFMIQGGGHTEDMTEKPTRAPIANEANRGLKKYRRHNCDGTYRRAALSNCAVLH